MSFDPVDEVLEQWLRVHKVRLYKEFKGEPVRSFDVVSPTGDKVQIWIDPVSDRGDVHVHIWDYRRRRRDLSGTISELIRLVDDAHATAQAWLSTGT